MNDDVQDAPQAAQNTTVETCFIHVRGIVQGVGFRPFVYRLAQQQGLRGWVLNDENGVQIHLEGSASAIAAFIEELRSDPPTAARIASIDTASAVIGHFPDFAIRESSRGGSPTVRISPDLPVCNSCLRELLDSTDRRYHYPFINCTECGPRYSIIRDLPYDRSRTTMADWAMCSNCEQEYTEITDRRFHAQPVACPECGPRYYLRSATKGVLYGEDAILEAVQLLHAGAIVATKGLGGYHLACDARNQSAVQALRERKFRKEQPFALMVRDVDAAQMLVEPDTDSLSLLTSVQRPIVLIPVGTSEFDAQSASVDTLLPGIAPGNRELGVMLPYTPLHHLLFESGAPTVLVMTSANRSSEPIAYCDEDAFRRLSDIADAFLVGERPIARRVDDSIARMGPTGPMILRRARGYAPGVVASLPATRPILAVGADLKNSITLVVKGEAIVSQHIGDLSHHPARESFRETINDLLRMYDVPVDDLMVVHDMHPEYASTQVALDLPGEHHAVQHHRAHIASVLAEDNLLEQQVVGIALDGTGYGDDGTIWGGEIFLGSVAEGFERVAHLHPASLPGGDAAARNPVQAAAGFLLDVDNVPDLLSPPFNFPSQFITAQRMAQTQVRTFATTSAGRLFDTVAALLGFTRQVSFEGQAAIWLEHLSRDIVAIDAYPFPDLDYRPLLQAIINDRLEGRPREEIGRAFHRSIAQGFLAVGLDLCNQHSIDCLVLSGGVFQNMLLLNDIYSLASVHGSAIRTNHTVPPNDGGISLGQAAIVSASTKHH